MDEASFTNHQLKEVTMIGQMRKGEDIEHYADKKEEQEAVLRRENLLDALNVVDSQGNWILGEIFGYGFNAKVYTEANENYGITSHGADGHISKLTVKEDGEKVVFNYDRGFDSSDLSVTEEADIIEAIELYINRNL